MQRPGMHGRGAFVQGHSTWQCSHTCGAAARARALYDLAPFLPRAACATVLVCAFASRPAVAAL